MPFTVYYLRQAEEAAKSEVFCIKNTFYLILCKEMRQVEALEAGMELFYSWLPLND
jgi:hypothetical protein